MDDFSKMAINKWKINKLKRFESLFEIYVIDHWLEMLDNPRKPVAQWYPLMETVAGHIPAVSSEPLPVSLSCLNSRWVVANHLRWLVLLDTIQTINLNESKFHWFSVYI